MTVQTVIATEFSEQDIADMAEANRRLGKLYRGAHLDEWLAYIPKLTAIRTAALHAAQTNNMKDRRYGIALKEIMHQLLPKFLDGKIVRSEATHLMWLAEEERLELLAEHRAKLTPAQHVALATPKGARNCVARIIAARGQPRPGPQEQAKAQAGQPRRGTLEADLLTHFPPQLRKSAEVATAIRSIAAQFDAMNAAHIEKRIHEVYGERAERAKRILQDANRKHPFTRAQYSRLLMVAHPDNSASEEVRNQVTRLLEARKYLLRPEEDLPMRQPLPVDANELQARRRK